MESLNKNDEADLLGAVKDTGNLVDSGLSPDAAIEKVARDRHYGPGQINLLCYAHNNGQQLAQFNKGGNILDKLASFELADPEKIISAIYPAQVLTPKEAADRTTVSDDYRRPPDWVDRPGMVKAARAELKYPELPKPPAPPVDHGRLMKKAYSDLQRSKLASEEARLTAFRANEELIGGIGQIVGYFKQAASLRVPFGLFEQAVVARHGEPARVLCAVLHKKAKCRDARYDDKPVVIKQALDLRGEPFTTFDFVMQIADTVVVANKAAAESKNQFIKEAEEKLGPFAAARFTQQALGLPTSCASEKRAYGFGTEVAAIAAGDIIGTKATHQKPQETVLASDEDNAQNDEINSVRMRGMLGHILGDPNNHLGGHPTPEVVHAFNTIMQESPELLERPSMAEDRLKARFKPVEKKGFLGPAIGGAIGSTFRGVPSAYHRPTSDLVDDEMLNLDDPEHQNEMRRIKAHSMLNSMMTDEEDPISGYDPHQVLGAYNEISQLSPRSSEQPAVMKPMLRRYLQGNVQPFEAKEMTDIEKGIVQSRRGDKDEIVKESADAVLAD